MAMMMITLSNKMMMKEQYARQLVKRMKQPIAIKQIKSTSRRVVAGAKRKRKSDGVQHGTCELDSHADTTVAGSNCIILSYSRKECDVSPYREDYESIKNVPIVTAATAWQPQRSGQVYILVFNEALWMGDMMESSLVNPNQLRHHGVRVQDNPMSEDPLSIISEDEEFGMELKMKGTIVYANTFTPSKAELESCQRIHLTSQHPWEPNEVKFPKSKNTLEDVIGSARMISALRSDEFNEERDLDGVHHVLN